MDDKNYITKPSAKSMMLQIVDYESKNTKSYIFILICIVLYFSCTPISSSVIISKKINQDLSIGKGYSYEGLWLVRYRNDTLMEKNQTMLMIFDKPTKMNIENNYYLFSNEKGKYCIIEYKNGSFYKYHKAKNISKFNKLKEQFELNDSLSVIK